MSGINVDRKKCAVKEKNNFIINKRAIIIV
jgi:hypothetical protein